MKEKNESVKIKEIAKSKELSFTMKLKLAKTKNEYVRNLINARYFMARCNMLAEQISSDKILEKIDGCTKSREYMLSEYALQKMQSIMSMRNSHFAKQDLFKDFGLVQEDIESLESDYYDGKIMRESYDESYKKKKDHARFTTE